MDNDLFNLLSDGFLPDPFSAISSQYHGNNFSNFDDVVSHYSLKEGEIAQIKKILFAYYDYESYEGISYVLYVDKNNNLYEVEGSHCSCFGLEEQWHPEKVVLKELTDRITSQGSSYLKHYDGENVTNKLLELLRTLNN